MTDLISNNYSKTPVAPCLSMGGSPVELSEEFVTQEKRKKGWGMNCELGEATEALENEL